MTTGPRRSGEPKPPIYGPQSPDLEEVGGRAHVSKDDAACMRLERQMGRRIISDIPPLEELLSSNHPTGPRVALALHRLGAFRE